MNINLQQGREKLQGFTDIAHRFLLTLKSLLREQFNKNIYTRILFTNVTVFVVFMIVITIFSTNMVKQATYEQAQQELLRKARRVNFAILQQTNDIWKAPPEEITSQQVQATQDALKFLADTFDARITVFDQEGNIIGTSAEQEVVPGSTVENKFREMLTTGKPTIIRKVDRETGHLNFVAFVPMGSTNDPIENGILLEAKSSNLDRALNKMRMYLLIGGMATLIVIIFISVNLATYISRPISRLTATVAEISRGNYIFLTDEQPLDEINDLTGQLNKMTVSLQMYQTASRKIEEDRSRMFAEISHELRTPLTAVQGFVEAIRDGMAADKAVHERYLDTIYNQTVHITRLVDDMLSLSRLESGNITVEKLPLDLTALAQGVVMSMEGLAKSKNVSLLFEKKTEKSIIIGDVDRMEQIIRNLLKNAIRATENGIVKVGAESRQYEVLLTIADNGVGIPPDDLPYIWDRFYRVKKQRDNNRQEIGSGLGLVIVKKLIQLQDGKIDVTSCLGKGTTFSITFPSFTQDKNGI